MSKSIRQSQVQTRILLALNRGPVPTIAELARLVQVLRPSAHRSLANLMEKNMVIRDGGRWKLTRSGMEAVASAQEGLKVRAQKLLTKTARAVTRLSMVASLTDALSNRPSYQTLDALSLSSGGGLKAVINSTQETLLGFSPFRDLVDPITLDLRKIDLLGGMVDSISGQGGKLDSFRAGGMVDSIRAEVGKIDLLGGMVDSISGQGGKYDPFRVGGMVDSISVQGGKLDSFRAGGMVDSISGQGGKFESVLGGRDLFSLGTPVLSAIAMDPLLQVQKMQNDLLGSALLSGMSSPLTIDLGQSNRILSKAVESLSVTLHESIARPLFGAALTQAQPLFNQLVDITKTYHSYMDDQFAYLARDLKWPSAGRIAILPTEALATYVGSVATFAEAQTAVGGADVEPRGLCDIQQDLDRLLLKVSPELCDMRRGAWDTFYSRGRDRLRQATHSMRVLIEQITCRLAPNSSFEEKALAGQRITRKMRLKNIAHGSDSTAEYVDALANFVNVQYAELAKVAHWNAKHEMSVRLMLEGAERAILLLLIEGPFQARD